MKLFSIEDFETGAFTDHISLQDLLRETDFTDKEFDAISDLDVGALANFTDITVTRDK